MWDTLGHRNSYPGRLVVNALFVSYSHHDEDWMRRLTTHLLGMPKAAAIDVWVDTLIGAGDLWYEQIVTALDRSKAAVLLLSADFLASSFIKQEEIPRLLQAEAVRGLTLLPLLAKPCAFEQHDWLASRQVRPAGAVALSAKSEAEVDVALADLAREIARLDGKGTTEPRAAENERFAASPQAAELRSARAGRRAALYFFYLSRERIHTLFSQLPLDLLRMSALETVSVGGAASTHLPADPASVAASRLSLVLEDIERHGHVGDLARVIEHDLGHEFDWYLVDGLFEVHKWDSQSAVVLLTGRVSGYAVTLSCTKSNVLGLVKEGMLWIPTSASYFLFEGGVPLALKGLIRIAVADRGKQQIMATPLYLTLHTALG